MSASGMSSLEASSGLLTIRGAFKIGAAGAVGAIADAKSKAVASVTRISEGLYEVTLVPGRLGLPIVWSQIITPLAGVVLNDATPAAGELVAATYVSGSWNQTTRKFRIVTTGIDDELVEDPANAAAVWFAFTGPTGIASVDKGFVL